MCNLSVEMKHGAFNMILKADDRACNGNSQHSHNPRKLTCQNHKWRQCSSLSSISRVLFTLNSFHKASQPNLLCGNIEVVSEALHRKRPELWPREWILCHYNAPANNVFSVKQFGAPKIDYWNGTPTFLPWLAFRWLMAVSKNKVCLKGKNISGYWRHPKKKVPTALKIIPQQSNSFQRKKCMSYLSK